MCAYTHVCVYVYEFVSVCLCVSKNSNQRRFSIEIEGIMEVLQKCRDGKNWRYKLKQFYLKQNKLIFNLKYLLGLRNIYFFNERVCVCVCLKSGTVEGRIHHRISWHLRRYCWLCFTECGCWELHFSG